MFQCAILRIQWCLEPWAVTDSDLGWYRGVFFLNFSGSMTQDLFKFFYKISHLFADTWCFIFLLESCENNWDKVCEVPIKISSIFWESKRCLLSLFTASFDSPQNSLYLGKIPSYSLKTYDLLDWFSFCYKERKFSNWIGNHSN